MHHITDERITHRFSSRLIPAALAALMASPLAAAELPPDIGQGVERRYEEFRAEHGALYEHLDPNDYRHPYEIKIQKAFAEDDVIQGLMPRALELAEEINEQYHKVHSVSGVIAGPNQYPDIWQMAKEVSASLAMKSGFTIYIMNSAGMNAYTWSIDQENYGVALFSGLINGMTKEQLRFVIGHEMGHVKSKHVLSSILTQLYYEKTGELPEVFAEIGAKDKGELTVRDLFRQSQHDFSNEFCSEFARKVRGGTGPLLHVDESAYQNFIRLGQCHEHSSDRAGIVATGDRENSLSGLVKLASGDIGDADGFDLDPYLEQIETALDDLTLAQVQVLKQQQGSHPYVLMRVGELDEFFESAVFEDASQTVNSDVYTRVVSACHQINGTLIATTEELEEFKKTDEYKEMDALERRFKVRELEKDIEPRESASGDIAPIVTEPMYQIGLAEPNAAFDTYVAYARKRETGVPVKALTEEIIEKIQFALGNDELTPEQRAELERKLAVATEIRDLGQPDDDDDDE